VVDYLAEQADRTPPQVPRNFGLPFPLGSRRRVKPGPYGGFLGAAYDTIWSEFRAQGTREVFRDSGAPEVPTMMIADPYLGILPTDSFEFLPPAEGMTIDRLQSSGHADGTVDAARRDFDDHATHQAFDRNRALAFSVLTSGKLRDALDVQSEPSRLREQYGMTLFANRAWPRAGFSRRAASSSPFVGTNTAWSTPAGIRTCT